MNRMIYYYPAPILENATSASGIRPWKMLEAFRSIGYAVDLVSGYSNERQKCIDAVKRNVKNGIKYDFAYGEDTTLPFAMNNPSHIPFSPFMDYAFWAWMKRNDIPFGCFYRDMYWRFPEYRKGLAFHKWAVPLPFHYLDIVMLKNLCKAIFFPCVRCAEDLPFKIPESQAFALPPGCENEEINIDKQIGVWDKQNPLKLFYVGGILPPSYDIAPVVNFAAITNLPIELTICCREKEFKQALSDGIYKKIDSPTIKVVHESGAGLRRYWEESDIFIVLREKARYLRNAMPFKVSESIGWGLPIIISTGSAAADMVREYDFGWTIEPREEDLYNIILSIINDHRVLENKRSNMLEKRSEFTWKAKANSAAKILTI